jgi:hypothetical protein
MVITTTQNRDTVTLWLGYRVVGAFSSLNQATEELVYQLVDTARDALAQGETYETGAN